MPLDLNLLSGRPAKPLFIGESGAGKTGAKAALIAMGYKLRMIDTDKGADILDSLLFDDHYPYKAYMEKHNITPDYSCVPFDIPMGLVEIEVMDEKRRVRKESIIGPTSGATLDKIYSQLNDWITPNGQSLGNASTWGPDTILDLDSFTTFCQMAKVKSQYFNNHPGALADEHGRDSGAAQDIALRYLTLLTSSSIKCNVIVTTHITRVDTTSGIAESPAQRAREKKAFDARGYPAAIGRVLPTQMGKLFNTQLIAKEEFGRRFISTLPLDNTSAKASAWLEPTYSIENGLAKIFCALRQHTPPEDIDELNPNASNNTTNTSINSTPKSQFGGF